MRTKAPPSRSRVYGHTPPTIILDPVLRRPKRDSLLVDLARREGPFRGQQTWSMNRGVQTSTLFLFLRWCDGREWQGEQKEMARNVEDQRRALFSQRSLEYALLFFS